MPESAPAADWSWQDDPDVISWDWRQGPDLDELRDLLARHGLSVAEVNTGTDDVAIRISSTPVEVMEGALCRHEPGQPLAEPRRPGAAPARAAGENRTGNRPNLAAAGRTPPDRHQDTPEGAGANSGQEPTTAEETTMSDPCVFCEIVAGREPATVVRRWTDTIAIVPLQALTDGHLLVIPKTHIRDASESPHIAGLAMTRAAEIAKPPFNIITSAGRAATQSVWHLHLHIVPRREDDGLALPWWSGRRTRAGGRP